MYPGMAHTLIPRLQEKRCKKRPPHYTFLIFENVKKVASISQTVAFRARLIWTVPLFFWGGGGNGEVRS